MEEGRSKSGCGCFFEVPKDAIDPGHIRARVTRDDSLRAPPSLFVGDEPRVLVGSQRTRERHEYYAST